MMEPLRDKGGRRPVSRTITLPAPTRGWFVYENLSKMPPATAYLLENFFPGPDFVRLRGGCEEYATGMTGSVETLMIYNNGAKEEMFAVANGDLFEVSTAGAVGAALDTGLTNDLWQSAMMTTTGGSFLVAVNGADDGLLYDGSTWANTAITGVSEQLLSTLWVYKNRLYFVEENTTNVWYLGVDAIAGAATKFALGGVFPKGGAVLLGATWSIDSGSGLDDVNVFISTEGEVAVYTGSYPGDTAWGLKGVYQLGKPLGLRSVMKAGGDLAVLTENGLVPLSKALQLEQVALDNEAVTRNIQPEFRRAVADRVSFTSGWQVIPWPAQSMFLIATPKIADLPGLQFVANMVSGAWCRFTGWDAKCFAVYDGFLYYGGPDGRVMKADTLGQDDGDPYSATMFMSFDDYKRGAQRKSIVLTRVNLQSTTTPNAKITIRSDYNYEVPFPPRTTPYVSNVALWDTAIWDEDLWPIVTPRAQAMWRTTPGFGSMIAPVFQITMSSPEAVDIRVTSIDVIYESGDVVG